MPARRLFDHAFEVLTGEQQALEDIAQLRQGQSETLSLALSASINRFHAPGLISAYYRENPQVRMQAGGNAGAQYYLRGAGGECGAGVRAFPERYAGFRHRAAVFGLRHLVVSPGHPRFEEMKRGDADALKQTPLITSALDSPDMRPSIQRLRDQFSTVWEVSSLLLRIYMVARRHGRDFYRPASCCRNTRTATTFHIIDDVSFGTIDKQVGLYYRAGKQLSRSASRFVALCDAHWSL